MKIKAVLFDLDGTLLDTMPDFSRGLNHALESCGFPTRRREEFNQIIGGGIRQALRLAILPQERGPEGIEQLYTAYQTHYRAHCLEGTQPYPGIGETLDAFAAAGVALGVFTNKTEDPAERIIRHYFPDIPWRFIWGNVDGRPLKPRPEAGFQALELLDLKAGEVAYVGDSDTDIQFALACGMLPVGAVWGYRGREELSGAGAAILADKPKDLLQLLQ